MSDPDDWQFESGRRYTAAEFDAVPPPVCRGCDQPMYVTRVPAGYDGGVETFLPVRARCTTPGCPGPRS